MLQIEVTVVQRRDKMGGCPFRFAARDGAVIQHGYRFALTCGQEGR